MIESGHSRFRGFGAALLLLVLVFNPWTLSLVLNLSSRLLSLSSRILIGGVDAFVVLVALLFLLRNAEKLRRDLPKYALLIATLMFCAVFLEVLLRVFTPSPIFHADLALYPFRKFLLHPTLAGVPDKVLHTTNKWGMRGDPIPGDWDERFTILAIGGSTTHCYYLPDDKTWPALLQAHLRRLDPTLMVQNAGLDGHSTRGHLLMMQTVVPRIRPDLVVLLVGLNDLSYSTDEQHLLFGNPNERTGAGYYIYANSRLVQLLYKWFQIYVNKTPVLKPAGQGSPDGYHGTALRDPTPLPEKLESILPSLEEFRSNVIQIIKRAKELNITPVFLTQPILFEENTHWDGIGWGAYWLRKQKYAISAGTLARMLIIFNENLLSICESEGIPCFDLGAVIPHDQEFFYDAAHFNEAGAARVTGEVADYMEREGLIPAREGSNSK